MEDEQGQPAGRDQDRVVLDLVALLHDKRAEIALAWAELIRREMADTPYGRRPVEEIRDNNLTVMDVLHDLLVGSDYLPVVKWAPLPHTSAYSRIGMRAPEVVEAVRLSRQVLDPIVSAAFPANSSHGREARLRLEAGMSSFAALATEEYATQLTSYLDEQYRRTETMLSMARAASVNLELENVLSETVKGIAAAVGVDHGRMILIGDDGREGTVWAAIGDAEEAPDAGAPLKHTFALSDTTFIGPVVEQKRPLVYQDVERDSTTRSDPRFESRRWTMGVPCVLDGRVLGVALVFSHTAPRTFTPAQIELAEGIANVAAPAIENARLHRQVTQLTIAEERARLAQELHDELAQTLSAMRFHTSVISGLLAGQQTAEAEQALRTLEDMIGQAHVDVREAIYNLRSLASLQAGDLAALQSYLSRYEQHHGLAVELQAGEEAAGVLAGATGVQVLRVLQEALTNVRKHGRTRHARIELVRDGAWVVASVQDDGQGFDPAAIAGKDTAHIGLEVMRERAEKVGGTLSIRSEPGRGTRVELRVPYGERAP